MISEYFALHAPRILLGLVIFAVSLVVSSIVCVFILLRLPDDYFHADAAESMQPHRSRWSHLLRVGIKNVIGVGLLVLGLLMSLPGVPGQGLLTMFMGIVLLDLPGKRTLERRVISRPGILRACNRLRIRFGKNPFTLATATPIARANGGAESKNDPQRLHGRMK